LKKGFLILLCLVLVIVPLNVVLAQENVKNQEKAEALKELHLFNGTNAGFELERAPTRVEGAVMLVRLLGKEEEALQMNYTHPFNDVPSWANAYIGFMYESELTKGKSENEFGSTDHITSSQYITFVLRALGYNDSIGDFQWNTSVEKAVEIGLVSNEYSLELKNKKFLRDDVVGVSYSSLTVSQKNSQEALVDKLISEKAIEYSMALKLEIVKPVLVTLDDSLKRTGPRLEGISLGGSSTYKKDYTVGGRTFDGVIWTNRHNRAEAYYNVVFDIEATGYKKFSGLVTSEKIPENEGFAPSTDPVVMTIIGFKGGEKSILFTTTLEWDTLIPIEVVLKGLDRVEIEYTGGWGRMVIGDVKFYNVIETE
jgi:hypothetical protein